MFALVLHGNVVEIVPEDLTGKVHESLTVVACPDGTNRGDSYDGKTFTAPAPLVSQQQKQGPLRAALLSMDSEIPRALEDTWTALGMDMTKLPAATRTRLAAKVAARQALQALIASNTP